jgi:uncharacterized protein YcfJ
MIPEKSEIVKPRQENAEKLEKTHRNRFPLPKKRNNRLAANLIGILAVGIVAVVFVGGIGLAIIASATGFF